MWVCGGAGVRATRDGGGAGVMARGGTIVWEGDGMMGGLVGAGRMSVGVGGSRCVNGCVCVFVEMG